MIRWAPSEIGAPDLPGASVLGRLRGSPPRGAMLIALWIAVVVAELLALRPVLFDREAPIQGLAVVFTLIGGSFAACGLVAWRRRPDSHSGMLMTATGFLFAAVRWWRASGPRRRALLPSLAGAFGLLCFAALLVNDLVSGTRSQPLLWIAACSLVTVPLAFLAGLLRSRLARGGLAELFRGMGTQQGADLEAALRRALGDPSLELVLPETRSEPVAGPGRAVAPVEREDRRAALVYDASLDEDPELIEAACAATAVALENQQLHAESLATVATTVTRETPERLTESVGLAAYFVASEALANVAKYPQATHATVRVWQAASLASIEIADHGIGGADDALGSGLRGLRDRVEARDGQLRIVSPPGAGTVVTAELPCAS